MQTSFYLNTHARNVILGLLKKSMYQTPDGVAQMLTMMDQIYAEQVGQVDQMMEFQDLFQLGCQAMNFRTTIVMLNFLMQSADPSLK